MRSPSSPSGKDHPWREQELITLKDRALEILDVPRLQEFSGFTANYLHLDERNGTKEPRR